MRRTRARWLERPCGASRPCRRNARLLPSISISESTGSTVVPATSCTTDRSSPASRFSNELLPTLGLPTSATRRGPPPVDADSATAGSTATTSSSRSATPRPCIALTAYGCPSPKDHNAAASASPRSPSTLLAARNTGLPDRRKMRAAASSPEVAPTTASTTSITASAVRIATDACSATSCCKPFASGSQPPVSCTTNRCPVHSAS